MTNKDYIKYICKKDVKLHNIINNNIEEILSSTIEEKEKNDLIKSLNYINDEYAKLESLENLTEVDNSEYRWSNGKDKDDNLNSFNELLNTLISNGDIREDGTYDKDIELIIKTMIDREIKLKIEKLK